MSTRTKLERKRKLMAAVRAMETEDAKKRRKEADRISTARSRAEETAEARQQRRTYNRISTARSRAKETEEAREKRRTADRISTARSRAKETAEATQQRRAADRISTARTRAKETAEAREERREMAVVRRKPVYEDCDGLLIAAGFCPNVCRSVINYKPKPNDLFIVTYPKCGTTWMQHIVMQILRRGKPFSDAIDLFYNTPFLEMTGMDIIDFMTGPGAFKSHLPFHLIPYSPDAKYIFVARNPKDCCVSFYYHTKLFGPYDFQDGTFDDYFEVFIKGEVDWCDYFDHLLGWYEHKNDPNVHFTTYEKMKCNVQEEIFKVAKFLGDEHERALREDPVILQNVIEHSSLEYMKKHMNQWVKEFYDDLLQSNEDRPLSSGLKAVKKNILEHMKEHPPKKTETEFVRKGVVGDWKNHFSKEQERRLEERIAEKTADSDVMNLWAEILG